MTTEDVLVALDEQLLDAEQSPDPAQVETALARVRLGLLRLSSEAAGLEATARARRTSADDPGATHLEQQASDLRERLPSLRARHDAVRRRAAEMRAAGAGQGGDQG